MQWVPHPFALLRKGGKREYLHQKIRHPEQSFFKFAILSEAERREAQSKDLLFASARILPA
jgi:hypothetical protein